MSGHLDDSYLEGRENKAKLQLQLVKKQVSQDGGCLGSL